MPWDAGKSGSGVKMNPLPESGTAGTEGFPFMRTQAVESGTALLLTTTRYLGNLLGSGRASSGLERLQE